MCSGRSVPPCALTVKMNVKEDIETEALWDWRRIYPKILFAPQVCYQQEEAFVIALPRGATPSVAADFTLSKINFAALALPDGGGGRTGGPDEILRLSDGLSAGR